MNRITDAISHLQNHLEATGCEDGIVTLGPAPPGTARCQFESGTCVRAWYGGKTADTTTNYPLTATTRVSFMYGRDLKKPEQQAAAVAIINVMTGFLCLSRTGHSCSPDHHQECRMRLVRELEGKAAYLFGLPKQAVLEAGISLAGLPAGADILLIAGDGLMGEIPHPPADTPVLCVGPSVSGTSVLLKYPHWCPFGTG